MGHPELVVLCSEAYNPRLGPVGYNSSWEGELAVRLADGSVVKVGARLAERAISDYSGSSGSWDRVKLHESGAGWLVKIYSVNMEMGVGEWTSLSECWVAADADAAVWRKLDGSERPDEGALVDELDTPATTRTIYVKKA